MSQQTNSPVDHTPRKAPAVGKAKMSLKALRDKMREPVKGIFRFNEAPGQTLHFNYREFKEDPIERYSLEDGKICTIPLGVARHINKNLWYPVHSYTLDENGKASTRIGTKMRRATFQSLEFIDPDDLQEAPTQELISVEKMLVI